MGYCWHRRGTFTLQDADNGDEHHSTEPPGHTTLLAPTDPKIEYSHKFKNKKIPQPYQHIFCQSKVGGCASSLTDCSVSFFV